MFTSLTNMLSSVVSTIHNPDAVEIFEFSCIYSNNFEYILSKYNKKFDKENLEQHGIVECAIIGEEINGDILKIKRIIDVNLLKLNFSIPESVMYYFDDKVIKIEHLIEINKKNKLMTVTLKNITHPKINFNEVSTYQEINNNTVYKLNASLSVNILFGINEIIRKLWYLRYKLNYENDEFIRNMD
jgi:hypothetical protein